MACYSPLRAFRYASGDVEFKARGTAGKGRRPGRGPDLAGELSIPCGQCIGCRVDRAQAWSIRCCHEAQMHEWSSFVTLTYDDAHCPRSLDYSHFQSFMRRLRRARVGQVIRFYMCGEYGSQFSRPHFHALLFGVWFPDRVPVREGDVPLYRSAELEGLWPSGFSSVGDVTPESAEYVARYCVKKVTGPQAREHYTRLDPETGEMYEVEPEFSRMSLRPGIGAPWLDRFGSDVYSSVRDGVMRGDRKFKPPRYYDLRMRKRNPELMESIDLRRYQESGDPQEKSPDRLAVREVCAKAKLNLKRRSL